MYRIIIALDVEAPSAKEAYRRVFLEMKKLDRDDFQWESTDEWYDPEGEQLDEDEVSAARMTVFAEETGMPPLGSEKQ